MTKYSKNPQELIFVFENRFSGKVSYTVNDRLNALGPGQKAFLWALILTGRLIRPGGLLKK